MKYFIEKLISRQDLSDDEMGSAFDKIMSGGANDTLIGAFLVALRAKGEKPSEIASAARIMREKALKVDVDFDVVDTCGTGGDGALTFNISTAVAFVLAGAGFKVAKHGNRSVSSSSGSADCLEALGIPIDLGPEQAARLAGMVPNPRYYDRNRSAPGLGRKAAIILGRMPGAEVP